MLDMNWVRATMNKAKKARSTKQTRYFAIMTAETNAITNETNAIRSDKPWPIGRPFTNNCFVDLR